MRNVDNGALDGPDDGIAEVDGGVNWRLVAGENGATGWQGGSTG